jgi:hypothetical protein
MKHLTGFAMEQLRGSPDGCPVGDRDRLQSQAHAEHRHPSCGVANQVDADPSPLRRAWARRDEHAVVVESILGGDLVVAAYLALGTELGEVLHQVEDKTVVVVDHEDPSRGHDAAASETSIGPSYAGSVTLSFRSTW